MLPLPDPGDASIDMGHQSSLLVELTPAHGRGQKSPSPEVSFAADLPTASAQMEPSPKEASKTGLEPMDSGKTGSEGGKTGKTVEIREPEGDWRRERDDQTVENMEEG